VEEFPSETLIFNAKGKIVLIRIKYKKHQLAMKKFLIRDAIRASIMVRRLARVTKKEKN
jgi:hypothetical protein